MRQPNADSACGSDGKNFPSERPDNADNEPLDHEEGMAAVSRSNEDLIVSDALPWQRRALASFTMYGELSVAHVQEEFAPLRMRLQQEWIFDAGFVSRFIMIILLFLISR